MEISTKEYKELVRQSEKLEMIKRFVEDSKYMPIHEVKIILGMKEEEEDE